MKRTSSAKKHPRAYLGDSGTEMNKRKRRHEPPSSEKTVGPERSDADEFRKLNEITLIGPSAVPIMSFNDAEAALGKPITDRLRKRTYNAPTPVQAQTWPLALEGKDVVAVAKAGSGKTLSFLLPALARLQNRPPRISAKREETARPHALIIVPTRELAQQIGAEATEFASGSHVRIAILYGGVPKDGQINELRSGADVAIATPGRLIDFSEGNETLGRHPIISFKEVTYLVLDEADRMLDMGFGPDIRRIVSQCPSTRKADDQGGEVLISSIGSSRQTLFFTATWPDSVRKTAAALTSPDAVQMRVGRDIVGEHFWASTDVKQVVRLVKKKDRFLTLLNLLHDEMSEGDTAIVFVKARRTCDALETRLHDMKEKLSIGTWCRGIHSGKDQAIRDDNLATFRAITAGTDIRRRGILVATDVASRGLDIPGVAAVVLYDFSGGNAGPKSSIQSYVHRIGRTSRAGRAGKSFTFFTQQDAPGAKKFVKLLDKSGQEVPDGLRTLAAMSPEKLKDLTPETFGVLAKLPKQIMLANAADGSWLHRVAMCLGLSVGLSKRAAKRAKQKAASMDVKPVALPKNPSSHTKDKRQSCKHKRHRLAAKAMKETASFSAHDSVDSKPPSQDKSAQKKCRHKRHRLAAQAMKEAVSVAAVASFATKVPTQDTPPKKACRHKRHRLAAKAAKVDASQTPGASLKN